MEICRADNLVRFYSRSLKLKYSAAASEPPAMTTAMITIRGLFPLVRKRGSTFSVSVGTWVAGEKDLLVVWGVPKEGVWENLGGGVELGSPIGVFVGV